MRDTNTNEKETKAFKMIMHGLAAGKCYTFISATCYFHYRGNTYLSVRNDRLIVRNCSDGAIDMTFTKDNVITCLMKIFGATPLHFLAACK